MKRILRNIRKSKCRDAPDIPDDVNTVFKCTHLQYFNPTTERFNISNDTTISCKNIVLPSEHEIVLWKEYIGNKTWKAMQRSCVNGITKDCVVFVKTSHLLEPVQFLRGKYTCPSHPYLPQDNMLLKSALQKIYSSNNQAYVDNAANYILSRFRECGLTPHCTLYYGSMTGISDEHTVSISDEYASYRQCRWFWKGLRDCRASIQLVKDGIDITNNDDMSYMLKCPCSDSSIIDISDSLVLQSSDKSETVSIHSICSYAIDNDITEDSPTVVLGTNSRVTKVASETLSHSSSDSSDFNVLIKIPSMPVILIFQEAHEGTMDSLLELDHINDIIRDSKEWTRMWTAWLWQIVATLSFLQRVISFTHNDLHTNNLMWRTTAKKYLYYKSTSGTIWKVPTYGKIFSIIDFGRSIFRFGEQLWVSDDHWPEQDAGGQYNFGPFFDPSKPRINPNPSFDLCRLAISMVDGLFRVRPPSKKGNNVKIMSKEGKWKIKETINPLFNTLWRWMMDDTGKTIYEDKNGTERHSGFELYIQIAHKVHRCIPNEQLNIPLFNRFIYKGKTYKKTVYPV